MKFSFKEEVKEFKLLLSSVPAFTVVVFVLSVVSMNLLANKSIDLHTDYLALDCGIIVSWGAFLSMDMLTKHFGPKAATQISLLAVAVNLALCLMFFVASKIPGFWGESFVEGGGDAINGALDNTFGGTWYVLLGSTAAFIVSAVVNNTVNFAVGKAFKRRPDGIAAYILRTYVSTAVGQFVDNFVFAIIVSRIFFGWSWVQCVTCAVTGMLVELACEAVFAHLGYFVCKKWKERGVGKEYFDYVNARKEGKV
ncbi:MAG: VUT family protein [Clostridiales bacterium]|nr:VUT family protein [Clostridiales bacterium]